MAVIEGLAEKAAESKINEFFETIRFGWNNYSFVFYITGVSAILGAIFGIAGWLSIIVTVIFFFYAGKFRRQLEKEKSKKPWKVHVLS